MYEALIALPGAMCFSWQALSVSSTRQAVPGACSPSISHTACAHLFSSDSNLLSGFLIFPSLPRVIRYYLQPSTDW